jgi:hypothetical protein
MSESEFIFRGISLSHFSSYPQLTLKKGWYFIVWPCWSRFRRLHRTSGRRRHYPVHCQQSILCSANTTISRYWPGKRLSHSQADIQLSPVWAGLCRRLCHRVHYPLLGRISVNRSNVSNAVSPLASPFHANSLAAPNKRPGN